MENNNEVMVGNKPFMTYIGSVEHLLKRKNLKAISLKARGRNITKAVDLLEASKNKFFKELELEVVSIKTSTSSFNYEGSERVVSEIEIKIKRN